MDLVTGGTGIVGTHLLLHLVASGRAVRATRRPESNVDVVRRVFKHHRADGEALFDRIAWVESDMLDPIALEDAMQGVEHVYHSAALVSFDPRDDRELFTQNITGTANVVNAALGTGVKRLLHVSSNASIGKLVDGVPANEANEWERDANTSAYAVSKVEAELEVQRGIAEGLDAVLVNPCIVLGPGMAGRSSMTMVERIRKGTRFYPPGSNSVVDARDVAAFSVALMEKGATGEKHLLVGENLSYLQLFTLIATAFGKPGPVYKLQSWMLGLAWRLERLRTLFGGKPLITRHTAHTAMMLRSYDASKAMRITGLHFRSAKESVADVVRYLGAEG